MRLCCFAGHRAYQVPAGSASAECGDDGQAGAQQQLDAPEHCLPGGPGCPVQAEGPQQGCAAPVCLGPGAAPSVAIAVSAGE